MFKVRGEGADVPLTQHMMCLYLLQDCHYDILKGEREREREGGREMERERGGEKDRESERGGDREWIDTEYMGW